MESVFLNFNHFSKWVLGILLQEMWEKMVNESLILYTMQYF